MDDSTEGLLIEGMRQLDEYRVHAEKLPELSVPIGLARPLKGKLRDLSPEELDVFQAALEVKTVAAVFDQSPLTDLIIAEKLVALFEKGYLVAGELAALPRSSEDEAGLEPGAAFVAGDVHARQLAGAFDAIERDREPHGISQQAHGRLAVQLDAGVGEREVLEDSSWRDRAR